MAWKKLAFAAVVLSALGTAPALAQSNGGSSTGTPGSGLGSGVGGGSTNGGNASGTSTGTSSTVPSGSSGEPGVPNKNEEASGPSAAGVTSSSGTGAGYEGPSATSGAMSSSGTGAGAEGTSGTSGSYAGSGQ